jgi:ADP-heptose:LPS heptosyltransferase
MLVSASARSSADRRLRESGVPDGARVIVMHVSAGNPFRRWPEESFAEVAAGLLNGAPDRWLIITGGPCDRDAADRVLRDARQRAGDGAGRLLDGEGLPLDELRALMDRAALFVGGDSGPLHVASTSDVPIVGLFGPTLPERPWRPDQRSRPSTSDRRRPAMQPARVRPRGLRCLTGISVSRTEKAEHF